MPKAKCHVKNQEICRRKLGCFRPGAYFAFRRARGEAAKCARRPTRENGRFPERNGDYFPRAASPAGPKTTSTCAAICKIPPRMAEKRDILREKRPLVWSNGPKTVKNTFSRATPQNAPREPRSRVKTPNPQRAVRPQPNNEQKVTEKTETVRRLLR